MTDTLYEFYCSRRTAKGVLRDSRYEIWERGEALEDSVTPSTYCPAYREHMVRKISALAKPHGSVFSIGCGNAFVEADLVANGLNVQAIDCNEEAVKLAVAKGVDAFPIDYYDLPLGYLSSFCTVYADGLIGHLYLPEFGLDRFFETMNGLKPVPGTFLVLSNDAPLQNGVEVAANSVVSGFWLLSTSFINNTLTRFGYDIWESYTYTYHRPISGLRNRSICIARVRSNNLRRE